MKDDPSALDSFQINSNLTRSWYPPYDAQSERALHADGVREVLSLDAHFLVSAGERGEIAVDDARARAICGEVLGSMQVAERAARGRAAPVEPHDLSPDGTFETLLASLNVSAAQHLAFCVARAAANDADASARRACLTAVDVVRTGLHYDLEAARSKRGLAGVPVPPAADADVALLHAAAVRCLPAGARLYPEQLAAALALRRGEHVFFVAA